MALTPLISAEELRLALSFTDYMAIFDEQQTGLVDDVDASSAVSLCLRRAHIRCVSWLGANYAKLPLSTDSDVSDLLKDAELNYAMGIAYDMHPEYTRITGRGPRRKSCMEQAELTMQRIQEGVLKMPDSPSMGEPENIGGVVYNEDRHMFIGSTNGSAQSGDF